MWAWSCKSLKTSILENCWKLKTSIYIQEKCSYLLIYFQFLIQLWLDSRRYLWLFCCGYSVVTLRINWYLMSYLSSRSRMHLLSDALHSFHIISSFSPFASDNFFWFWWILIWFQLISFMLIFSIFSLLVLFVVVCVYRLMSHASIGSTQF